MSASIDESTTTNANVNTSHNNNTNNHTNNHEDVTTQPLLSTQPTTRMATTMTRQPRCDSNTSNKKKQTILLDTSATTSVEEKQTLEETATPTTGTTNVRWS